MQADAGQIAARASNTGDEAVLYRVDANKADDRDYRGRLFGREDRTLAALCYDDIDVTRDEFGRSAWQPIVIGGSPAIFDRNVPALNVAAFGQPLTKRGKVTLRPGIVRRCDGKNADHRHRFLRACHRGP